MANLQKIRTVANQKGIAIPYLAGQVGLTPQALQKLIRVNSTSIETLEKIALELKVSPIEFFDDDYSLEICRKIFIYENQADIPQNSKAGNIELYERIIAEKDARIKVQENTIADLRERIAELKGDIATPQRSAATA